VQAERDTVRAREEAYTAREEYQTRVQQITEAQRHVRQQAQEEARDIPPAGDDKAENISRICRS